MPTLSWPSIAAYCVFGIFVFYQQLHVKNFHGASQSFALALSLAGFVGWPVSAYVMFHYIPK
jgi:hypothetical protein